MKRQITINFQSSQKRAFDPDAREFVIREPEYGVFGRLCGHVKDGQKKRRIRRAEMHKAKKNNNQ